MSGMHLLPAYYTTTNTRKRKQRKKSKSLLEAEQKHEKFLSKICGKSGRVNDTIPKKYQRQSDALTEGSIPSLSNTIPVGVAPKKQIHDHKFTIAPAYNKGPYMVISKKDIKDIGR
tara:strand:- start:655 stop:1002 length:348 start_codon:yes stop_codon:yes gene_type:complete